MAKHSYRLLHTFLEDFKLSLNEMGASIANHSPRNSKSQKYDLIEKFDNSLCIVGWRWYSFDPFGYVIHHH